MSKEKHSCVFLLTAPPRGGSGITLPPKVMASRCDLSIFLSNARTFEALLLNKPTSHALVLDSALEPWVWAPTSILSCPFEPLCLWASPITLVPSPLGTLWIPYLPLATFLFHHPQWPVPSSISLLEPN